MRRTALFVATIAAFATILVFQFASLHHHVNVHVERHRILRRLQQTTQSLRLHFKVKRDTMMVHGLSEFDVLANPVLSTNADGSQTASFDGIATFVVDKTLHTYTLVDNVAYYTSTSVDSVVSGVPSETASCLPASTLPPIADILAAIDAAKHVSTVNADETVACASNALYKLSFAGESFVLCSESGNSLSVGFKVYGADLDIDVTFLVSPVAISAPTLSDDAKHACEKISSGAAVSTSTAKLLTGAGHDFVNHVFSRPSTESVATLASSSCSCKGARRPCLFFHGVDQKDESGLKGSLDYFGDIQQHAPCCSSVKFATLDTVNSGWNSAALQQKVCDISLRMSSSSNFATKTIEDTIIVGHSMGNLMLGGAISTGKCSLAKSSEWVAISGPVRGSMGSDLVQTVCAGGNLGADIVKAVARLFGQCPASTSRKTLSYEGERYTTPTLQAEYDALQVVYKKYVTAAMCSNSYVGLVSLDQPLFILGGTLVPHKSNENDGIVEYASCIADLDATKFASAYTSPFYKSKLNHLDTAFRHGDALFSNAKKPVKWFECLL